MPRTININTTPDCRHSLQGAQLAGNDRVDGRVQARASILYSPRRCSLQACAGQACGTAAAALPASKPSTSARETTHALYTTIHKPQIAGWMRRIISGSCAVSCTSRCHGTTTHHCHALPLPQPPRQPCGA